MLKELCLLMLGTLRRVKLCGQQHHTNRDAEDRVVAASFHPARRHRKHPIAWISASIKRLATVNCNSRLVT
jgi:hypothetical protein